MRQRVIPILAPVTKPRQLVGRLHQTTSRGMAVLNSPSLNKGTAFTAKERKPWVSPACSHRKSVTSAHR